MSWARLNLERWWARSLVGGLALGVVLIAAALVFSAVDQSETDLRVAVTLVIYIVLAAGLQVFGGPSGLTPLAYAGFVGLGAYIAAILTTDPFIKATAIPDAPNFLQTVQMGFVPATLIAVVLTMAVGFVLGLPIVRLTGGANAVAAIGLLVILHSLFTNVDTVTRGARGFYGVEQHTDLWLAVAVAVVMIAIARLAIDSGTGLGLKATRGDELAAQSAGVGLTRTRIGLWTVSCGIAAAGGSLYVHYVLTALPNSFYFDMTLLLITMVIIGGLGITGAVLGAGLITVLQEFLRRLEDGGSVGFFTIGDVPGLANMGLALLVILILIRRPTGILGRWELEDLWIWWRRRGGEPPGISPGGGEATSTAKPASKAAARP